LNRIRPYGEKMQQFIDQWDATDHKGKVQLCTNWGISYDTGKHWRQIPPDEEPFRPQPIEPLARGEVLRSPLKRTHPNIPLTLHTGEKPQVIAVLNDTHNPFQDLVSLALVETFLKELQPDILLYNGDANDFYQLSKFDKNPTRISKLQEDLDNTRDMFKRHREICPNTIIKFLLGNHEDRLERFIWVNAPALSSLRALDLDKLFGLGEFEIEGIPYESGLMINDIFLAIHGDIASIHSGYTAKRMYEKHGGCGICGHCHRGGSFYKRDRFGIWGWWEGFCLCQLNPDWIMNPNWVQGFSLIHFRGKRFWVEQIPIIGHAFMYGGKLYEPEKVK